MAIALSRHRVSSRTLATWAFETLHQAESSRRIDYGSWRLIDHLLPRHESVFGDWDRCERIRRGLVQVWTRDPVAPLQSLVNAIDDDSIFAQLLRTMRRHSAGHALLQRLEQQYSLGQVSLRPIRAERLRKEASKRLKFT